MNHGFRHIVGVVRIKLAPRADGPFEIVGKVNDNAYKVELPSEYGGVSATFNVGDLSPYLEDELDLRANPSQPGEDDTFTSHNTLVNHCGNGIGSFNTLTNSVEKRITEPSPKTLGLNHVEINYTQSAQVHAKEKTSPIHSLHDTTSSKENQEDQAQPNAATQTQSVKIGPKCIHEEIVQYSTNWVQFHEFQSPHSITLVSRIK